MRIYCTKNLLGPSAILSSTEKILKKQQQASRKIKLKIQRYSPARFDRHESDTEHLQRSRLGVINRCMNLFALIFKFQNEF
jgi:hypothetical protein